MRIPCSSCAASRALVETKVEGAIAPVEDKAKAGRGRAGRAALDDPRRRPGHHPAPGRQGRRRRLFGDPGRHADDRADQGPRKQPQRIADARLPDRGPLRDHERARRIRLAARFLGEGAAKPRSTARGRPRDRRHRHRNRRGERDGRSFRAPVGRRQGDDDAERDQRLGQDGQEPAGRSDPAAAALPQSARPGAGRGAPRSHPRSGPCPQTRRGGADRPRRRPGTVRHPRRRLSRPEAGEVLARRRAHRRGPARRRPASVDDGAQDRGRRLDPGAARSPRRRAGPARGAEARRERRRDPQADAELARGGATLRRGNGDEGGEERRPDAAGVRTRKSRASTS